MNDTKPAPRPAVGHMPFAGHRTVATVWAQQDAAKRREARRIKRAAEYGFDPESLKVAEG